MSNYNGYAVNPRNGNLEEAVFLDDFYGRHQYAVKFHDGTHYPEYQVIVQHCERHNLFYYRGFAGEIEIHLDEPCGGHWVGKLLTIPDLIMFGGCNLERALLDFKEVVDEYIEDLKKYTQEN